MTTLLTVAARETESKAVMLLPWLTSCSCKLVVKLAPELTVSIICSSTAASGEWTCVAVSSK